MDGTGKLVHTDTLLLGGHDVERQDGEHSPVHRHRDGHLVEGNLVEQDLHIEDGVHGHTCFADVAHHARVVGVVATVGGQVKGDGEALLSGSQVAAVEGVGLFGGGESGVLADGPRTERIHHRIGSAQERRDTGGVVEVFHTGEVIGTIHLLDGNLLRSQPVGADVVFLFPFFEIFLIVREFLEIYVAKIWAHSFFFKRLQRYNK